MIKLHSFLFDIDEKFIRMAPSSAMNGGFVALIKKQVIFFVYAAVSGVIIFFKSLFCLI